MEACISGIYYIKSNDEYNFEQAVEIICCEESIGIESISFSDSLRIYAGVSTASSKIIHCYKADYEIINQININEGIVKINFPIENIIQTNSIINAFFTTLMGDLFGIDVIESIKLLDIELCEDFIRYFPGPKFGIERIKQYLKIDTPLVGVIVKPNLGLTPSELGGLVYNLCIQGADFIKDDELMMSTKYCPLQERVKYVRDAIERAKVITKKDVLYAINISADAEKTYENAFQAAKNGANCLMLNVFTTGFDILHKISADRDIPIPIHTHRCMHDIFTYRENYGVSPLVFAKLVRLCGADFYHIGIFVNKSTEKINEMLNTFNYLTSNNFYGVKETLPIVSRSSLLSIKETMKVLPKCDVLFLLCGAYYRSENKENIIRVIKSDIQKFNDVSLKVDPYYEKCIQELESMYYDAKKG